MLIEDFCVALLAQGEVELNLGTSQNEDPLRTRPLLATTDVLQTKIMVQHGGLVSTYAARKYCAKDACKASNYLPTTGKLC